MSDPNLSPPAAGPRPLPVPWYLLTIVGVMAAMVAVAVTAEHYGKESYGEAGGWAGRGVAFVFTCLVCAAFSRYVGNHTAVFIGAVLVAMAASKPAEEAARQLGIEWSWLASLPVFFGVYMLWALVVHRRLGGRWPRG